MDCLWCRNMFNTQQRRPYSLECGDSVCEECWKREKAKGGPLNCLGCGKSTLHLEEMKINFGLKELVETHEIFCDQHPAELSTHFCFSHIVSLCSICYERHRMVYPEGDNYLIPVSETQQFDFYLRELCQSMQKDTTITPADRKTLENAFKSKPKDLVKIVCAIIDPLKCMGCGDKNFKFVNLAQSAFACENESHRQVTDDGSAFNEWIEIKGQTKEERIQFLLGLAKDLLRKIPTAVLRKDALDAYCLRLENSEALQVRDLLYYLRRDVCNAGEMKVAHTLPATSQCLVCLKEVPREDFFRLRCFDVVHEICWDCACLQSRQMTLTCPVDGQTFAVDNEIAYQLSRPPLHRQSAEERKKEEPNFVETDQGNVVRGGVVHLGSEVVTISPIPPPSDHFPCVSLFNHVIPEMGSQPVANPGNNKPWYINPRLGVADAIIIGVFSNVYLRGMTVSLPLVAGMQVFIEYIKVYALEEAKGPPLYELPNVGVLEGGNGVCADIWFPNPLLLTVGNHSLKMKLSRGDNPEVFMMYRGSPFSRPDYWISSLGTVWEFNECKMLDEREHPNGQCNLSGPFLRFYFTPAD